jgi:phospholipid/cholesterol/gamma-HCH transport system substrate-binding protein
MKRRDEVTVGILITVAVTILVLGTLWLVRGQLKRGYPLFASFTWGHSLKQGQSVVLAGVTVGYVAGVRLNPGGTLDVDLVVNNKYQIPKTAVAEVFPVGIFGDVIVALRATKPGTEFFSAGDTIPSRLAGGGGLDALMARGDTMATSLGRITKTLEAELITGRAISELHDAIRGMSKLVSQIQGVVETQDKNVTATLATVRTAVDSAEIGRTSLQVRTTAASVDSLAQRMSSLSTQLQAILARLERGEGSAGMLMRDSSMYVDTRRLIQRMDSLMADFQKNPRKYIKLSIF